MEFQNTALMFNQEETEEYFKKAHIMASDNADTYTIYQSTRTGMLMFLNGDVGETDNPFFNPEVHIPIRTLYGAKKKFKDHNPVSMRVEG